MRVLREWSPIFAGIVLILLAFAMLVDLPALQTPECENIDKALAILDEGKKSHLQYLNFNRGTNEDFTEEQIAKWEAANSWNWKWVKNYNLVIGVVKDYKEAECR